MKKWLFNPFIYLAGMPALLLGIAALLATATIGYFSNTHFDGVLDIHTAYSRSLFIAHLLEQLTDWGIITLLFFIAGSIFSRSAIRLIDVAGTMAVARWPLLLAAIIGFGIHVPAVKTIDDIMKSITPATIALSIGEIVCTIWFVTLAWNAFTISCNLKGGKAIAIFIVVLILGEIASKIILFNL